LEGLLIRGARSHASLERSALSTNYKAELRWKNRKPFRNLLVVD
jgi:hypothetical protein